MKPLILSLTDEHTGLLGSLAQNLNLDKAKLEIRSFPDGETYIRFDDDLKNRDIIILNSLDRPNQKILPLIFLAKTAKEFGAKTVGLCAPYLAYMRQDKRFKKGECITSIYFAKVLSDNFDWLVTIDPHLHRYKSLKEIYSINSSVLHIVKEISDYIENNVENPLIIGPDSESEQWVKAVAYNINSPYIVLEKNRISDNKVSISIPNLDSYLNCIPVLLDDIISTGHTMLETIKYLKKANMQPAVCIGIHAIFSGSSYKELLDSGIDKIVTCNTINHPSNGIDIASNLSEHIRGVGVGD